MAAGDGGVARWAAAARGFSFGSSAWLACRSDFAGMRRGSTMAVSSPRLVSRAIGQAVDLEELGGWKLHAETTGQIDMVVDTDEEALDAIRTFLRNLQSRNMEAAPELLTGLSPQYRPNPCSGEILTKSIN